MINEYKKIIILSVVLVVLIGLSVLFMTTDLDLKLFKTLSFAGIETRTGEVNIAKADEIKAKEDLVKTKESLETTKQDFDTAKKKFDSITEYQIETIEKANTDEEYFIEYLWVELGNYARANKLTLDVKGVTAASTGLLKNQTVQIVVEGRYANVADFVFDVENDKTLKFKLDNIKMVYTKDNLIEATFDVLSLSVEK